MSAKYVVHTVGPVWRDGTHGEPELLASCYRRSLALAAAQGAASVAFPCISTGVYGYPIELATKLAIRTVRGTLPEFPGIREVLFCCFSAGDLAVYEAALAPRGS